MKNCEGKTAAERFGLGVGHRLKRRRFDLTLTRKWQVVGGAWSVAHVRGAVGHRLAVGDGGRHGARLADHRALIAAVPAAERRSEGGRDGDESGYRFRCDDTKLCGDKWVTLRENTFLTKDASWSS